MAECSSSSVSVRGSDAEFEHACTTCAEDGSNHEALKYCLECKQFLCSTCIKYHLKFSTTRQHTLLEKDFQQEKSDFVIPTSQEMEMDKCHIHPGRDIEMYCGSHDMVYCALCIAKDHRICNGVMEVEEAADRNLMQLEKISLSQIDTLLNDLLKARQQNSTNSESLDQERIHILKKIEDTKHIVISKVEKLSADAKMENDIRCVDLKKELQKEDTALSKAIDDIVELKDIIQTQETLNAKRRFVRQITQIKHILARVGKLHVNAVCYQKKKIKCFTNDDLLNHVTTTTFLVQTVGSKCRSSVNDKPLHIKSQKEVNVKETGDKETCNLYGICLLSDGTIVLADHSNQKLKRLNKEYRVTEHCDMGSNPTDICCTGYNEVAVKLKNHTVQFMNVRDGFSKTFSINIEGGNHIGLAYVTNELWCFNGACVKVYNRDGTVVKTFYKSLFEQTQVRPKGNDIIPVAADDEFLYVSDLGSQVACLDREGNVWSVMSDQRLELVRRACVSRDGIIFVAGYTSGNVLMFNEKAKCLGELIHGLERPNSLCYDSSTCQLVIGYKNKDTITIIETSTCS